MGGLVSGRAEPNREDPIIFAKSRARRCTPIAAYAILRGHKTLALRMERHQCPMPSPLPASCRTLPRIDQVFYQVSHSHPGACDRRPSDSGWAVSWRSRRGGGFEAVRNRALIACSLVQRAAHLGAVATRRRAFRR